MDITLNQEEHGHSLEKRRADDLDEEERQLEALIEEVYSTMGVKASLREYSYVYAFMFSRDSNYILSKLKTKSRKH